MKNIHEHDVLMMMMTSDDVYTKPELHNAIISKFGEEARFYTCSVNGMDSHQLIEKLDREGNFLIIPDGVPKEWGQQRTDV